jgi:hypothetical protein
MLTGLALKPSTDSGEKGTFKPSEPKYRDR